MIYIILISCVANRESQYLRSVFHEQSLLELGNRQVIPSHIFINSVMA